MAGRHESSRLGKKVAASPRNPKKPTDNSNARVKDYLSSYENFYKSFGHRCCFSPCKQYAGRYTVGNRRPVHLLVGFYLSGSVRININRFSSCGAGMTNGHITRAPIQNNPEAMRSSGTHHILLRCTGITGLNKTTIAPMYTIHSTRPSLRAAIIPQNALTLTE